jgi:4-hydroxybenzoate polyprenyltransferase
VDPTTGAASGDPPSSDEHLDDAAAWSASGPARVAAPQPTRADAQVDPSAALSAPPRSRLRDWAALLRIFLTPTAPADSLAGWAIASSLSDTDPAWIRLIGAMVASICLYWTGMVTNDIFDVSKDRRLAPGKPLASGAISLGSAVAVAIVLGIGGLVAAAISAAFLPAVAVLAASVLYNGGGKRVPVIGNLLMGSCRAGNLLLGASAAVGHSVAVSEGAVVIAAIGIGLFISGVTAVSLLEDRPYRALYFYLLTLPVVLLVLAIGALSAERPGVWIHVVLVVWLLFRAIRGGAARLLPIHPAAVFVRGALASLQFFDAALVAAFAAPGTVSSIAIATLYALGLGGWLWKRRWLQSGQHDT